MNQQTPNRSRRNAIGAALAVAAGVTGLPAQAQSGPFPNRPIRIVAPFPPGASIDALARTIGQRMSESMGQQVIVDNRPGGNSTIGTDYVGKQPPDGYTVLMGVILFSVQSVALSSPGKPVYIGDTGLIAP